MPVKILFADDSAADRLILKSMLPDYTVVTAVDGADALRQIREQPDIGLVVLDLNMPNLNGFQVLETLRKDARLRRLRTILLTSSDEMENEIRGLQLGAADYIRKPLQRDALRARIKTHVDLLQIQQALE